MSTGSSRVIRPGGFEGHYGRPRALLALELSPFINLPSLASLLPAARTQMCARLPGDQAVEGQATTSHFGSQAQSQLQLLPSSQPPSLGPLSPAPHTLLRAAPQPLSLSWQMMWLSPSLPPNLHRVSAVEVHTTQGITGLPELLMLSLFQDLLRL